jgi:tetratricopeptide (TPR) repeat protein
MRRRIVSLPGCLLLAATAAAFPGGDALEGAEALLKSGKPAEARARIESRLAEKDVPAEERPSLLEALGRCLRAEERPWDAEAAFGSALEARPDYFEAALGRGEVFLALARSTADGPSPEGASVRALAADARRWLQEAARLRKGDGRVLRGLLRARLLDLDFKGAAAAAREALAAGPDAETFHLLAEALRGAGERDGAAKAEADCLALAPGMAEAAARQVGDLVAAGDREGARRAARDALLRDPGADEVYRALWDAEAAEKRYAPVEEVLLAVLAKHPDHPRALFYLGYAQLSSGRREVALETFRRKAAAEPDNPQPRVMVGRLLVARGDLAEAEKAFEAALPRLAEDSPDRASALEGLYAIGSIHGGARRYAEAERLFRRLVELEPRSPDYRMYLGLSLRRLGRYADAEKEFLAAIESGPFDGTPRNELGLLYLGWGRPADARRLFEESAREDPRTTPALENLGNMARAEGRPAEALERFREAYRRASAFRDEEDRIKFRRYLDAVAREREAAGSR